MRLTDSSTRHLFFTGKGGVGKTSNACATAVALADSGRRVLLVSTDPASNLDQVLGVTLGREPTPILEVPGLSAINIDPEAAARAYRERVVGPYRGVLPDDAVAGLEEQLSGACTVEVAAFDEFTELLTPDGAAAGFDQWCSIPPQRGTRFDSCSFPPPGLDSSKRTNVGPRAWGRHPPSRHRQGSACRCRRRSRRPAAHHGDPGRAPRPGGPKRGRTHRRGVGRTCPAKPATPRERVSGQVTRVTRWQLLWRNEAEPPWRRCRQYC